MPNKRQPPKLHRKIIDRIIVEGNKGGDFVEIIKGSEHKDNMVHLTVGHCCVEYIDVEIPVEVLTTILINSIVDGKMVNPELLEWGKEFNNKLLSQMENR